VRSSWPVSSVICLISFRGRSCPAQHTCCQLAVFTPDLDVLEDEEEDEMKVERVEEVEFRLDSSCVQMR